MLPDNILSEFIKYKLHASVVADIVERSGEADHNL
jgi:hypothetical protein